MKKLAAVRRHRASDAMKIICQRATFPFVNSDAL